MKSELAAIFWIFPIILGLSFNAAYAAYPGGASGINTTQSQNNTNSTAAIANKTILPTVNITIQGLVARATTTSPNDTIQIFSNGMLEATGRGSVSFNVTAITKTGTYLLGACDTTAHVCTKNNRTISVNPISQPATLVITTIPQNTTSSPTPQSSPPPVALLIVAILIFIPAAYLLYNRLLHRKKQM